MKLAIVGANGFIGSRLYNFFYTHHDTVPVTRKTVDLLDLSQLQRYLASQQFDCIVLCAATMNNDVSDVYNNLGIMLNFYHCRQLFGKIINTASGAEYDRTTDINQAVESDILIKQPADFYGLGQNLRSKICLRTDNFYNLRIFNCFGLNEIPTRIFPKLLQTNELIIENDRYFDYFSIQDLYLVVDHFITHTPKFKDINCVYKEKFLISEVANRFIKIHNLNKKLKIISTSNKNYTGSADRISNSGIILNGLDHGLINYLN